MHPPTSSFDLHRLQQDVAGTAFSGHLHHLASTSSTNDVAHKAALGGARNGIWIADRQIAGRGRGGHHWHSPAGAGLYMTALVAPQIPMQTALALSLRVAIAVQSAIVSVFGFERREQIDIRWPNDLMLNRRKVGGILIDTASNRPTAGEPATLRYAIVGIGVNIGHTAFPSELDAIATSIRRELPRPALAGAAHPFRREPLAAAILIALDQEIRRLDTDSRQSEAGSLAACSSWLSGKRVRVLKGEGPADGYTGTTAGLDPQGFLLVDGDDGRLHTVLSGGLREI